MSLNLVDQATSAIRTDSQPSEGVLLEQQVEPTSPQRGSTWWHWVVLLAAAGGAYAFGSMRNTSHGVHGEPAVLPEATTTSDSGLIHVTTERVAVRSVQRTVDAVGTLFGFEELVVSSKLEGRVAKIHHDLSSIVKPGDVLLELDETDAKLAVEQAQKSVQAELAKWGFLQVPADNEDLTKLPTVVSAKLRFDLAQSRLERMKPLKASNAISADDFEQASSEARVLESDYRNQLLMAGSAAATARLRNADLAIASQKLADCTIRVPTPTIVENASDQIYAVSERMVSEGTLLRPGTEVFRLVLGKTLKLRLAVPETFNGQIKTGQKVEVTTSASAQPVAGSVARISPAVDRSTRTFIVEVEVPNQDGALKPGSFAKARILIDIDPTATTVSHAALYSFAGIHKIFLVEQGKAREIKVVLGNQTTEWVEIASPRLPVDAVVVTSGQRLLSEGLPISIRDEAREGVQP